MPKRGIKAKSAKTSSRAARWIIFDFVNQVYFRKRAAKTVIGMQFVFITNALVDRDMLVMENHVNQVSNLPCFY